MSTVQSLVGRPIDAELDHLGRLELFVPTVAGRQQFVHALLQDAAYALIPKQVRGDLHIRLARWLDEEGAGDAVISDHLERAFTLRDELGQRDDETARIAGLAGTRLAAAGRRADAMGDPQRARRLLERALKLLPADGAGHAVATVELAAAAWNLFPPAEICRLLDAGADRAAKLGLRALELRARMLRSGADSESTADGPSALQMLAETDAALRELESLDDPRAIATALCTRAGVECLIGRAADSVASVLRALDMLLLADEDTVWALTILAFSVTQSPMPVSEGEALLGRLMDELGARPTVRSELTQGRAMLALLAGRTEDAWRLFDTAREIEGDLGRATTWRFSENHALMLVRSDRFEQARSMLPPMIAALEQRSVPEAHGARTWLGLAEVRLGNLDAATAAAIDTLDHADPVAGYAARARAHLVLSEVKLAEGMAAEAVRGARDSLNVASSGDWVLLNASARLALARALIAADDQDAAAEQAEAAIRLYEAKGYATAAAEARALRDSLPAGRF